LRILGGGASSITISPNPVNLGSVKLFGASKKKKKKVKPVAVTSSFTITNDGCAPVELSARSLTRSIGGSERAESSGFLTITLGGSTFTSVTLEPGEVKTFDARFNPSVPGLSSCASSSQIPDCLRPSDVLPNNFQAQLSFNGTDKTVTLNATVDKGAKLIDPSNPSGPNSLVKLCKSGDTFTVTYYIYDSDLADVKNVKYEFLDDADKVVKVIDGVDLAGPLGKAGLVSGMSFKVEQTFSGADDNSEVTKVRITVNSSVSATGQVGTGCGASIQSLWDSQAATVLLPALKLRALEP
jgi:hypothetical protein